MGDASSPNELESDVYINQKIFQSSAITPATRDFNLRLQELESRGQKWYEVGAAEYRRLRKAGLTPLPGATLLPSATAFSVPSRDDNRSIPCRVLMPEHDSAPQGIFMHIHGGGWVLNDETSSDLYLQKVANAGSLVCLSVGYRLAPEHPFPAGPQDCFDVATWLIDHGEEEFGTSLKFVGGESAGANLALLAALDLLRSPNSTYSSVRLKGVLLHYGAYSLQWHASTRHFKKQPSLILDEDLLNHFRAAYLPSTGSEDWSAPEISPFYADLSNLDLPPAFISCGTEDCLLEDSVFMGVRWMIAGGEAVVKCYPGSPHGFILFSEEVHDNTRIAMSHLATFINSKCA
ncbi:hypothetical protein A1O7_04945 [Cladophialophora yegresii CBS 114405]|uniref:Alpha/beta hydrolase fold-3 domain-containing protein n=1 Tax=Cladophialophora yegresii CBS 114405 TaxID=1182544 RepID=W9VY76_9EURO|nr:uncharacterized protein A1O7_04945 [Cladophialophora yegresii CBS 114405]EXJ60792.1 hypothetical protein A1O7_04945 [Cladophialophora yegresii CBS 114405]